VNKSEDISFLKAQLDEKIRIENYLRHEVKELRDFISFYDKFGINKFITTLTKLKNVYLVLLSVLSNIIHRENIVTIKNKNSTKIFADILFVLPTTDIEFGGSHTAYQFSKLLSLKGFKVIYIAQQSSPINKIDSKLITISDLHRLENIKVVISTGAETQKLIDEIVIVLKNVKRITLVQGPDPFFTPKWDDAKILIKNIRSSDLVIPTSFFLESLVTFWGAKQVITLLFEIDTSIFKIFDEDKQRNKIILVTCRPNAFKGLQILLPTIPKLRELGYKIIGFGILPDLKMAHEFDDFYGVLSPEELSEIFNLAKFLIDPSIMEGFGRVSLEAAFCGCIPIIQKRYSYNSVFEKYKEPYIEIESFQNPNLVISAIQTAEKTFSPKIIKSRVDKFPKNYNLDKFIEVLSIMLK
jgi:glycosyltransferase involved in cell wall biosynthesis